MISILGLVFDPSLAVLQISVLALLLVQAKLYWMTDDRRRMPSDGKSSHCLWQSELKRYNYVMIMYLPCCIGCQLCLRPIQLGLDQHNLIGNYNIFQMSRYPRLREEVERIVNTRIREQEQRVKEHTYQILMISDNVEFLPPISMPCFGSHIENGRHLENFENAELLL
jgi:hypothetical protein